MKIWKIALLVEDIEAAEKLYAETLGMEIIDRLSYEGIGEVLFLDAGGVQLELIPKAFFESEERLGVPGVHHLSFKADNLEKSAEELKAKGVNFIKEPFDAGKGMTLAFFDGLNGINLQLFNWKQ